MTSEEAVETLKRVECLLSAKVLEAEPMCDEVPVLLGAVRAVLGEYEYTTGVLARYIKEDAPDSVMAQESASVHRAESIVYAVATELKVLLKKGE